MGTSCTDYDFSQIETFWQSFWEQNKTFRAADFAAKPKYYILDMFPYPSGAGLHIGHPEGYTASDILARFKKAQGHNVLHPMGWDAFGLPAEQHAVATGTHPSVNTAQNVANFKRQIKSLGFALDWDREINTTDPDYFRWTQWIFLQLFKHGLAYVDEKPVWWCPALGTVLANEEVIDGRSERGNHPVERRALRQWVLRITAYADVLLSGLEGLDWPDSTKRLQANWIGRSEGAEVKFDIDALPGQTLNIFTTRPDTLFGVTYMVVAPEHPLLPRLVTDAQKAQVDAYVEQAKSKSDLDRTDLAKDKTGVFTGAYAINPVNGKRVPIWVADYVLISYGTGAIMAVPAHDERDFAFAKTFNLPIVPVILPKDMAEAEVEKALPFCDVGTMINSGSYTGMPSDAGTRKITADIAQQGRGRATVNYKLRDWLFSRQRYWGEPFPILWVSEADYARLRTDFPSSPLAEFLPKEPVIYRPKDAPAVCALPPPPRAPPPPPPPVKSHPPPRHAQSPLANARDWVDVRVNLATGEITPRTSAPASGPWIDAFRETNTMPQWAGSCWYYLRYLDPKNPAALIDPKIEQYWGTPDFYIGGAEHAVLHLLYARFWHRFLHDIKVVSKPEPFQKLFHQGIILGEDGQKMSKSRGNVVNPDEIISKYGCDTLRMFLMFLGPLEDMKPWNAKGIEGISRFLRKVWREIIDPSGAIAPKVVDAPETPETERALHETIKKVTEDFEALRFNTAISQLMIFVNHLGKVDRFSRATAKALVQLVAPMAPHIGEELWSRLGEKPSITDAPWPRFDPAKLVAETVKVVFQVNGKLRGEAMLPVGASQTDALAAARDHERVKPFLEGKTVVKEIYVPGKILNIVVK